MMFEMNRDLLLPHPSTSTIGTIAGWTTCYESKCCDQSNTAIINWFACHWKWGVRCLCGQSCAKECAAVGGRPDSVFNPWRFETDCGCEAILGDWFHVNVTFQWYLCQRGPDTTRFASPTTGPKNATTDWLVQQLRHWTNQVRRAELQHYQMEHLRLSQV